MAAWTAALGGPALAQEPASAPSLDYRPGAFVTPPDQRATDEPLVGPDQEGFSAIWANADIGLVVNQLVGDFLGLDYTIAPGVTGTITFRIEDIRTRGEAFAALRSALQPVGAVAVDQGDFISILPAGGSTQSLGGVVVIAPGDAPPAGVGAVIVAPRNIAPSEVARLIAPLAPGATAVLADDERQVLLISGDFGALNAASDAVALLDVDWFSQVSTGIFPLTNVRAEQLAEELQALIDPSALGAEVVPVPRLSSLIVLARSPRALETAAEWIRRLDRSAVQTVTSGLLVYEARNLSAERLAASVNSVMGAEGQTGALEEDAPLSTRLGETVGEVNSVEGFQGGALSGPSGLSTSSFAPTSSLTSDRQPPVDITPAAAIPGGDLVVAADINQNLVIVRGSDVRIAEVRSLLEILDRPRAQVLIEATIVEATLNDQLRYGVNWAGLIDGRLGLVQSDAASGEVVSRFPGMSITYVNDDIEAAINLLSSVTKVEVLSRPSVITLHNEIGRLQIGDQVPIITRTAVSVTDPDAPIVNQTTYRDTGVILLVRPKILAGGMVEVEISQEVSDVASTTTSDIDSPTISQRLIESTLLVPSGEAVALGGLISASRTSGDTGVPVLKDAPLVGPIFRSSSEALDRTELIVFLTPRILSTPMEAASLTVQLRDALQRLETELLGDGL